jgi:hypothetical protein
MAEDLLRVAPVSNLKLKSPLGVVFPFPFLEVMMAEGRKNEEGFSKSTRKEVLVYLVN